MPAQLIDDEGRNEEVTTRFHVARDRRAQALALGERLWDVRLRRPHALGRDAQDLEAGKHHRTDPLGIGTKAEKPVLLSETVRPVIFGNFLPWVVLAATWLEALQFGQRRGALRRVAR